METAAIDTTKTWTAEDYLQMDENPNQQLVNGKLIMSPSPSRFHQKISILLSSLLLQHAKTKGDEVYAAPTDVHLDQTNILQPDLIYVQKENLDKLSQRGIEGAPDLVIEIISPSNSYLDRYEKKYLYQNFKVKEYWIVDPGNLTLEVYQLAENEYKMAQYLVEKGAVKSPLLSDLNISLETIFQDR